MPPGYGQPAQQPTAGNVTGAPDYGKPATMAPTSNVTGAPTGSFGNLQPAGPAPQTGISPVMPQTPYGGMEERNAPISVEHKVKTATGTTTLKHQATPPQQAGQTTAQGDPDPDAPYLRAAAATGGGARPVGPAPAVRPQGQAGPGGQWNLSGYSGGGGRTVGDMTGGTAPQGAGYAGSSGPSGQPGTTSVAVPDHPGLLQRIGQTISHFFGGTLGQHQQPQTQNLGYLPQDQTGGTALGGVGRALHSGRQHVATHGGSAPASAPAPAPPGSAATVSYGYAPGIGPIPQTTSAAGVAAPLGDTDTFAERDAAGNPTGRVWRYDVTNPYNRTQIQ
jgi:hypothetical protein